MRKILSKKDEYIFVWPQREDVEKISPDTVQKVLRTPKEMRRNRFLFDKEDFNSCPLPHNLK